MPRPDERSAVRALSVLRNGEQPVRAAVRPYEVARGLANVVNRRDFAKELGRAGLARLEQVGFVIKPTNQTQPYEIYEENEYARPHRYPPFITTDALLHAYHQIFDKALEWIEVGFLSERLVRLSSTMYTAAARAARAAENPRVKEAAQRLSDAFATTLFLLGKGPKAHPWGRVARELASIDAHAATAGRSPIWGTKLDYTMFVPRGHYTRTERLRRFFRAMMWFGTAALRLSKGHEDEVLMALLATKLLAETKGALDDWRAIYDVTAYFVGPSDDITPPLLRKAMLAVWPKGAGVDALADPGRLQRFVASLERLPRPRIQPFHLDVPEDQRSGLLFKFMGQRFILDSYILQKLVHPAVPMRFWPTGLDVAAAFGFDRAVRLVLGQRPTGAKWTRAAYQAALDKVRAEVASIPAATWTSNLYWSWLHTMAGLLGDFGPGYPKFMTSEAWKDRQLLGFLGTWTELRHDTILYAKQSGAECGDDEEQPPLPKGYVEPNVVVWKRLRDMARRTRSFLAKIGARQGKLQLLADRLGWLEEWAEFCRRVSLAELAGKRLARSEYEKMVLFGAELEALHSTVAGGDLVTLTPEQKHMGIVADVHRSRDAVLEEGVGSPAAIYVVVPSDGKLRIARGAVFTHYEFVHPASDRLTDEKWKEMLKAGKAPPLARWLARLFVGVARLGKPADFQPTYGGC